MESLDALSDGNVEYRMRGLPVQLRRSGVEYASRFEKREVVPWDK